MPGSSCSQHSGSAKVEGNKERPWILFMYVDAMFVVFIYFKKEEYHIHFMLHCQHGALSWEFGSRMRCQFWTGLFISLACHTCHSLPYGSTNNVTLLGARRNKTQDFHYFLCSYHFKFILPLPTGISSSVQTLRQRITHIKQYATPEWRIRITYHTHCDI